jgi:hypothetical protein
MNHTRRLLLLVVIALCLLADAWALTRFAIYRPSRAVIVDARPGEATVKFEKMPIGLLDRCVLGGIGVVNIIGAVYVFRSWKRVGRGEV